MVLCMFDMPFSLLSLRQELCIGKFHVLKDFKEIFRATEYKCFTCTESIPPSNSTNKQNLKLYLYIYIYIYIYIYAKIPNVITGTLIM